MDLRFTEAHEAFRSKLRAWLAENLERPFTEDLRDPANDADALVAGNALSATT